MSDGKPFALVSSRVVTPEDVRGAAVVIDGERIAAIVRREDVPAGVPVEDLGNLVISPGLVDAHVHINEPGRTEWEGFETATRAAAAGGVTTLVDMPLNSSPVTTTVAALEEKRSAARGKCWVDVGFYGGLVPGNLAHIEPLIDAGVFGIKAFMCDSGLDEFPASSVSDLRAAGAVLARRRVPLLVHAELDWTEAEKHEGLPVRNPGAWDLHPWTCQDFFSSRWSMEQEAIAELVSIIKDTDCPTHVVHVSCSLAARMISDAKARGLPITAETCPHYLTFVVEEIDSHDTRFKCAPPIYNRENRGDLWQALLEGTIDTIGSDHSPCPPEMKCLDTGDFRDAWGGISSLQLTLSTIRTGAAARGVDFPSVAAWTAANPARVLCLPRKGRLASGCDADLCVWDPNEEWTVAGAELHHRHKLTPYEGERLRGRVKRTYVRGELVYDSGKFAVKPVGEQLKRSAG